MSVEASPPPPASSWSCRADLEALLATDEEVWERFAGSAESGEPVLRSEVPAVREALREQGYEHAPEEVGEALVKVAGDLFPDSILAPDHEPESSAASPAGVVEPDQGDHDQGDQDDDQGEPEAEPAEAAAQLEDSDARFSRLQVDVRGGKYSLRNPTEAIVRAAANDESIFNNLSRLAKGKPDYDYLLYISERLWTKLSGDQKRNGKLRADRFTGVVFAAVREIYSDSPGASWDDLAQSVLRRADQHVHGYAGDLEYDLPPNDDALTDELNAAVSSEDLPYLLAAARAWTVARRQFIERVRLDQGDGYDAA